MFMDFDFSASTDYRKKLAIDISSTYALRYDDPSRYHAFRISPRFRFSDKFKIIHEVELSKLDYEYGWVNELEDGSVILREPYIEENEKIFTYHKISRNWDWYNAGMGAEL